MSERSAVTPRPEAGAIPDATNLASPRGYAQRGPEAVAAAHDMATGWPALNAFVELRPEALDEAEGATGPLAGLPVAVKDMFVDGGRAPTCGSGAHATWLDGTAEVLDRLRGAGAVVMGRTNLHEYGLGTTSAVTASGPIRNPWDSTLSPGGSSGGSAAAVAAGIVPVAVGTDGGGSIRVPSAYCGLAGLKPTFGRVPLRGFSGERCPIDHAGPIGRSVGWVGQLFEVLAGEEQGSVDVSELRVGIARRFFFEDVQADVHAAVEEGIAVVRDLVASVVDVEIPAAEMAGPAVALILPPMTADALGPALVENPDAFQPQTLNVLMLGAAMTSEDRAAGLAVRDTLRAAWDVVFRDVDVVITPTVPSRPPPVDDPVVELPSGATHVDLANIAWNGPMNLGGVPCLSIPCGRLDEVLTTNMSLSAARGNDHVVIALGQAFEAATERVFADRVAPPP